MTERLLRLCREHNFTLWLAFGFVLHGWVLFQEGQGGNGLAEICQGIADWRATGAMLWLPYLQALLAESYGTVGQQRSCQSSVLSCQFLTPNP